MLARLLVVIVPSALVLGLYAVSGASATVTVNGVALCDGQNGRPAHDPTKWHPLVARDSSGSIICTYGHAHGMDPHALDGTFGALPLGQEISYPWATINGAGVQENSTANKHRAYMWLTDQNIPCTNGRQITAFREELHNDGSLGATARFHSYWGQYQLTNCSTGEQATIWFGGHLDYAELNTGGTYVPLPVDPPAACILDGDGRGEGKLGGVEQSNSVWYGSTSRNNFAGQTGCDDYYGFTDHVTLQQNEGTNSFGPVDPSNPSAALLYPDFARHTMTTVGTDTVVVMIALAADASGHVNFTGHLDRHGLVVPEVAGQATGIDYIPVVISNALPYSSGGGYSAFGGGAGTGYDADVPGPNGERGYYVQLPDQPNAPTATPTATSVVPTPTATATPHHRKGPGHGN